MSGNLFLSTVLKVVLLSFIPALQAQTLKITKTPDSPFYVEVGKVLTLDISHDYTGDKGIQVEWKEEGAAQVLVERSADGTISKSDNRASIKDIVDLVLTNATFSDNTTFEILLRVAGIIDKPKALIQVIVAERPEIKFPGADVLNVNKDGTVEYECSTVKGSPTPWVQWYDKDGTALGEAGYGTKILSLKNIQPEKAGTYKCKATVGKFIDEKTLAIIVQYGPTRFTSSNVESVSLGTKDFTISCKADGYPEPTYKLSHNSTEKATQNGVYTIPEIKHDDAGKYTCEAENNLGNISESFTLKVIIKYVMTTIFPTASTTGNSSQTEKSSYGNCDNKWYIILITLLCGILIGVALSFLTIKLRGTKQEDKHATGYAVPVPENTPGEPAVYQELGVRKTNEADNYQSLSKNVERGRENEVEYEDVTGAGYQELNNPRGRTDENYQSLQKV